MKAHLSHFVQRQLFQLDNRVRQSAIALQDGKLLAKLSAGDLMAQEAKYHPSCLASLYKRAKAQDDSYHQDYGNKINYSIALAELLSHIDDTRNDESVAPILKLADLVKLYTEDTHLDTNISWAAYHASQQPAQNNPPTITAMLPLFPDDSKSVAMMRHSMDMVKKAVQVLNLNQIPVITFDQPLYAIAKLIQWNWPDTFGENSYIIILGGLHIEMAALSVIGDWLEDSGWVEAFTQAKVASAGTAESFLKASHVTRTRHAHQVTASSLYVLLKKSYSSYLNSLNSGDQQETFENWCIRQHLIFISGTQLFN